MVCWRFVTRTGCWLYSDGNRNSLSLRFNGHFPGEPGLAGVYWSKGWRKYGDNWKYMSCKAPVKSSPPTNQHPVFFTGRMPFLSPNQQCQSTERKISHPMDLLTQTHLRVFQLCLWPLIAPGYLGEGLPCLSSAPWCQVPLMVTRITCKWCAASSEFTMTISMSLAAVNFSDLTLGYQLS